MRMPNLKTIWIIARQHFRNTALTKAFFVSTVLGPLFIVAVTILPSIIAQDPFSLDRGAVIGYLNTGAGSLEQDIQQQLDMQGGHVQLLEVGSEDQARQLLFDEEIDGYVSVNEELNAIRYVSTSETQYHIHQALQSAVHSLYYQAKLDEFDIPRAMADELTASVAVSVTNLSQDGTETEAGDSDDRIFLIITLCMLLYMTIMFYGQIIGRSVVLEKTSKTIELMMSSVTADELMMGKILGIGAAGMFQYILWIVAVLVLGTAADVLFGFGLPAGLGIGTFVLLLLFFVLGFLLYSAFYSAIGAASRDEQQVGQLGMPLIIFLIVPLMMFVPIATSPNSPLALFLSMFPMTSPLVMVMRSVSASIPLIQIALSAIILLLSIVLIGLLSARIFRTGILMTGKKVSMREILRWIRH